MKKQFLLKTIFLFILSVSLFTACKKKDKNRPDGTSISYVVNGTSKAVTGEKNIYAVINKSNNTLTVTSKLTSTSENVTFVIPNFSGKAEYTIPANAHAQYTNGVVPASNDYIATSGSVTITEYENDKVSGSFHFYSMNSQDAYKNITEGSFTAKVSQE